MTSARARSFERAVVVGAGMVGRLAAGILRRGARELVVMDRDPGRANLVWDVRRPPSVDVGASLANADLVLFALPDPAINAAIPMVLRARSDLLERPVLLI